MPGHKPGFFVSKKANQSKKRLPTTCGKETGKSKNQKPLGLARFSIVSGKGGNGFEGLSSKSWFHRTEGSKTLCCREELMDSQGFPKPYDYGFGFLSF